MSTFLKSNNAKMYFYLLISGLIFGLWLGGESINKKLGTLEVKTLPAVPVRQISSDTKSFYPVWIKQAAALKAEMSISKKNSDVEDLFNAKKEEPKLDLSTQSPKDPDYVAVFKQTVRLDAIADNGIYLNDKFFKIGAPLKEFLMFRPSGGEVIPVVVARTTEDVTFSVNGTNVVLKLHKPY